MWDDKDGKVIFWYFFVYLMVEVLEAIYLGVKFGIGLFIDGGFYYDVDFGEYIIFSDDFFQIEQKMLELACQKNVYVCKLIFIEDVIMFYQEKGDEYKLELLEKCKEEGVEIILYEQGNFIDFCCGLYVFDIGYIKVIKIIKVVGVYWQGDENCQQMICVYGIIFFKQKELIEYEMMIEEVKQCDYCKLGIEFEFFMFFDCVGQGLLMWLFKGNQLCDCLMNFLWVEQEKCGY